MQIHEALEQLDAIHEHLSRSEEYRGFKTAGVAFAGVIGLIAAAIQPFVAAGPDLFIVYWVAIAGLCALVSGGPALHAYLVSEDEFDRQRTRRVFRQFAPCLLAGGAITAVVSRSYPDLLSSLPGLWAIIFGLGIVSARPYLPGSIGWAASYFLGAGVIVLSWSAGHREPSGWAVGGVFGLGHLICAVLLARGREENEHVGNE